MEFTLKKNVNLRRGIAILLTILMLITLLPANVFETTRAVAAAPSNMPIGTNFWFLASWSGEKPFTTSVNWSNAYANGVNIWNPVFTEELKPYVNLRFMDWGNTNNSIAVSWSSRRLPTDSTNAEPQSNAAGGIAYEWMIDLCNRTGKDLWICVPHLANDDYITNLAKLIKDKLNTNLKCYLEYSNEVWNTQFVQTTNATNLGTAMKFQYPSQMYYTYRSFQMFKLFKDVFAEQMSTRVIRVCSFSGYLEMFGWGYGLILNDTKYNPNNQKADLFAVAPYVGSGLDGKNVNIINLFHNEIDRVFSSYVITASNIAKSYGVPLATYEGGQHLLTNADALSANPLLYNEYLYMFEKFAPYFVFFTHYNHCGSWASGGSWGAKRFTGQDINLAPKYKAIVDWSNSQVAPTPTPIPGTPTPAPSATLGDVNNDGKITAVDALMALQVASGRIVLTANQKLAADVNNDGKVTAVDALKILQYASGRISGF